MVENKPMVEVDGGFAVDPKVTAEVALHMSSPTQPAPEAENALAEPSARGSDGRPGQGATRFVVKRRLILITGCNPGESMEIELIRQVFRHGARFGSGSSYDVRIVHSDDLGRYTQPRASETALRVDRDLIDTLIITGPEDGTNRVYAPGRLQWLRDHRPLVRRMVGVASGTLVLAAAGLLNGRKAVTHWSNYDHLLRQHPLIHLVKDILYTKDGNVYTCAGGVASADLALSLLEEDCGGELAALVASRMLLHFRRTGATRQISLTLQAQAKSSTPIFNLLAWLPDHLGEDLSVKSLAKRAAMSSRNFARLFRQQIGLTPGRYVEELRLEAAQRELATDGQTISRAAEIAGYSNADALRRLFSKRLGYSPGQFRGQISSRPQL